MGENSKKNPNQSPHPHGSQLLFIVLLWNWGQKCKAPCQRGTATIHRTLRLLLYFKCAVHHTLHCCKFRPHQHPTSNKISKAFPGVSQRAKKKGIQWPRCFNNGQAVVKKLSCFSPLSGPFCLAPPAAWRFPELCSLLERLCESLSCFCFSYLKKHLKIVLLV